MATREDKSGNFAEYRKLILAELERQARNQVEQQKEINDLAKALVALQVKAGLWGAGSATLVALGAFLLSKLD